MPVTLPTPGEEPWGEELNTAISGIDARVTTLEQSGGGGSGDGGDDYSPWFAGKHWYALGTSLTEQGFYTGPLALLSGMTLHNLGASSQSLTGGGAGGGTAGVWAKLITTGTDAEVVTLETTNDWRLNCVLGAITDAEDHTVSFYGALKEACKWMMGQRPAARFFLITNYCDALMAAPTYGNFYTPNTLGRFQWEYNEAVRKVAQVYGVPIIDVAEGSGLNYFTAQWFTSDGLHLNTLGGTRFAEYVWSRMRTLGWLTTRPTAPTGGGPVSVTGVSINQGTTLSIGPGNTAQLTVAITPPGATNTAVTWASNAPAVATVSVAGVVTGVANGSATITVTTQDGGFTDTIAVTVAVAAVTGVDVTPATATLTPPQTQQLTATVQPTNAGNKTVTWQSSNPGVATVNSSGLVTSVAVGSATITATTNEGSFTDTCAVTVAASQWALSPQTTFREYCVEGLTATGSDPTHTNTTGGSFGVIFLNTPGHNAIEFTVKTGARGMGVILGGSGAASLPNEGWIMLSGSTAPFDGFNTKHSMWDGASFAMGAPTPTASPPGFATGVTYRIGRSGVRLVIVRVDPGNVLVPIWDGDLDVNWGGAHIPRYEVVDLGVAAYAAPDSILTLPINCKTGTWTPP